LSAQLADGNVSLQLQGAGFLGLGLGLGFRGYGNTTLSPSLLENNVHDKHN